MAGSWQLLPRERYDAFRILTIQVYAGATNVPYLGIQQAMLYADRSFFESFIQTLVGMIWLRYSLIETSHLALKEARRYR